MYIFCYTELVSRLQNAKLGMLCKYLLEREKVVYSKLTKKDYGSKTLMWKWCMTVKLEINTLFTTTQREKCDNKDNAIYSTLLSVYNVTYNYFRSHYY